MLAATLLAVFLIPSMFSVVEKLGARLSRKESAKTKAPDDA